MIIKQKQRQLKHLGYYKGSIDGIFGKNSKSACKSFQKKYKLVIDGIFGIKTTKKSIDVWKSIQNKLNNKINLKLKIDGIVGAKTINAIKKFQTTNKLKVDAIVGSQTLKALFSNTTPISNFMTDEDWKKIKYFKKSEFKCRCKGKYCSGYPSNISKTLVNNLETTRKHFKTPGIITSAVRCKTWNKKVGGGTSSRHLNGRAADIYFKGKTGKEVIAYMKKLKDHRYSYIIKGSVVHFDVNK